MVDVNIHNYVRCSGKVTTLNRQPLEGATVEVSCDCLYYLYTCTCRHIHAHIHTQTLKSIRISPDTLEVVVVFVCLCNETFLHIFVVYDVIMVCSSNN